ncbi:hypothetical protein AcV5_002934 [Taiwanofungus camphoratus]|nr:hypothetical protein AcV5_002934 [Antrodia cinnamomea]
MCQSVSGNLCLYTWRRQTSSNRGREEPTVARLKSHTTYYAGDSIMNASTRRRAREHVGDKIFRGLPVHEFVGAVWGFGPEDIPAFKQYTLLIRHVNMYLQRHVRIEDDSSLPLAKILEHLLAQINSGELAMANCWVAPLRVEFNSVSIARLGLNRLDFQWERAKAQGDLEKTESISAKMLCLHERLDERMTYEVFMEALELPTSATSMMSA